MDRETYLRQQLADLHQSYLRDAEPILKKLAEIAALKPLPPMFITAAHAQELGIGYGQLAPRLPEQATLHPPKQSNLEAAIARLDTEMQDFDIKKGSS